MKIKDTFLVVNNYGNHDLKWLDEYLGDGIPYMVFDKKEKNVGYNIFDYMDYIVNHYDSLPETIMFTKGNMLQRHITKEEFDKVCNNKTFTPLLTQNHKVDGVINYYKDGLYYENNNYWYTNHFEVRDRNSFDDLINLLGIRNEKYLGFAPGGCYIVPKANILKHSKQFYEKLRESVGYTQLPAEAHLIERSLYHIWQ